ncbi:MAG: class I poly(R)-hydroxyalkanoic acid synthase, partial [Sphingorhabdus sp.]
MADSPNAPPFMDLETLAKMAEGFGAGATDPLTAYKSALDAWGQVLAPLAKAGHDKVDPRDRRFAGPQWEHPVFDLMRQSYQIMSDYMLGAAEQLEGLDPSQKAKMGFAIRTVVEAM